MKVIDKKRKDLKMKEKIKNTTILEKTVRPDKAQMLKRVQDDKFGFTLAEVLITLGIIGVVAAMTMPSLIHKYQEKVRIQQYKKAMSLISQAIVSQYAANGVYYECGYGVDNSQCSEMFNDIQKYLKVAKFCENKAFDNGCIPDYDGMEAALKDSDNNMSDEDIQDYVHKNCVGFEKNRIKNDNPVLVLADGTIIVSYLPEWGLKLFLLDINGKKGPNKWGYDMFTAELRRSKGGLSLGPAGCMTPAKGGLTNTQMYEKVFYGK